MCIRDSNAATLALIAGDSALACDMASQAFRLAAKDRGYWAVASMAEASLVKGDIDKACLLYTSDAADERSSVDLGGRRIIKKKKQDK